MKNKKTFVTIWKIDVYCYMTFIFSELIFLFWTLYLTVIIKISLKWISKTFLRYHLLSEKSTITSKLHIQDKKWSWISMMIFWWLSKTRSISMLHAISSMSFWQILYWNSWIVLWKKKPSKRKRINCWRAFLIDIEILFRHKICTKSCNKIWKKSKRNHY